MSRDFLNITIPKEKTTFGPPEVSHQKDDVVFIRNPAQQWQSGHIISLGSEKAVIISLMEKRAIALLLSRHQNSAVLEKPSFSQDEMFRIRLSWDHFNTIN
jgi:hypothetical protein